MCATQMRVLVLAACTWIANGGTARAQSPARRGCNQSSSSVFFGNPRECLVTRANPADPSKTDISVIDRATGQETFWRAAIDVARSHYHSAEYHNGHLYLVRSGNENTGELWKRDGEGHEVRLFSIRGLDFRVTDDERLIAVDGWDAARQTLTLLHGDGTVLRVVRPDSLGLDGFSLLGWASSTLWVTDPSAGLAVSHIVKISAPDWRATTFDVSTLPMGGLDFDLNPIKERLLFSNRPFNFESEVEREYVASKAAVTLWAYDLRTRNRQTIANSKSRPFRPQWVSADSIEYDAPDGSGRVRRAVP